MPNVRFIAFVEVRQNEIKFHNKVITAKCETYFSTKFFFSYFRMTLTSQFKIIHYTDDCLTDLNLSSYGEYNFSRIILFK